MAEITPLKKKIAYRQGRIVEMRLMGFKESEIAEALGTHKSAVSVELKHIRSMALPPLKKLLKKDMRSEINHNPSQAKLQRITKRREGVLATRLEGKTEDDIAKVLKISHGTVVYDIAYLKENAPPETVAKLIAVDRQMAHRRGKKGNL